MLGVQPIQIGTLTCLPSHSKDICLISLQRISGGSHRMLQQPLSLQKVCQILSSHVKTFLTCTMCAEHMEVNDEAISTRPSTCASTGKAPEGMCPQHHLAVHFPYSRNMRTMRSNHKCR